MRSAGVFCEGDRQNRPKVNSWLRAFLLSIHSTISTSLTVNMTERLFDLLSEEAVKLFIVPVTMAAIGLLLVTKNYLRHTTPSSVRVTEAVQSNEAADKVPEEPKPPMSDDSVQKKIMEAQTQAQVAKLEADEAKAEAAEQVRKARSELRDAVKAQAAAELTAKRLYKLVGSSEVNTARPPRQVQQLSLEKR